MIRQFFQILQRILRRFVIGQVGKIAPRKLLFTPQPRTARIIEGEFRRLAAHRR